MATSCSGPTNLYASFQYGAAFAAINQYSGTATLADGVYGQASLANSVGVYGTNAASYGVGVRGDAASGYGVYGSTASNVGVYGNATGSNVGVYGTSPNYAVAGRASAGGGAGIYGGADTAANTFGVYGIASTSGSYAVAGNASVSGTYAGYFTAVGGANAGYFLGPVVVSNGVGGTGAYITTNTGHGVYGATSAAGYAGVLAQSFTAGSYALEAAIGGPATVAALFTGQVTVSGNFAVTGAKSAALPHPDGSHRLVYCVEAPDSWLEDFGEGTITAGQAVITLDPDFVAVADTHDLHVFCFEHGDNHSLHLASRSDTGFTIAASADALAARGKKASDVTGTFSYRVVAKRKDLKVERFAPITLPTPSKPVAPVPEPKHLPPPPLPALPPAPARTPRF